MSRLPSDLYRYRKRNKLSLDGTVAGLQFNNTVDKLICRQVSEHWVLQRTRAIWELRTPATMTHIPAS